MDIGIGIAGVAISAGAVIITVIKERSNGSGNRTCPRHSGIEATLDFLKDGMDRIEDKLDKIIGG